MNFFKLFLTFSYVLGNVYRKRSVSSDSLWARLLAGTFEDEKNKAQDLLDNSIKNVWTPPLQDDPFLLLPYNLKA